MKRQWFTRKEGLPVPSSFVGWLVLVAAVAYLVWKFLDIDSRSHSASDTLMNFAIQVLIVAVLYALIALFTSSSKQPTD